MIKIDLTEEQAEQLQQAVDQHMERCWEVMDFEGEELPPHLDDVAMYCGCHVCETREHLLGTFNYLRQANIVDIKVE
jgi:hypothetical protein